MRKFSRSVSLSFVGLATFVLMGCQNAAQDPADFNSASTETGHDDGHLGHLEDDMELEFVTDALHAAACKKASSSQVAFIEKGNRERDHFLQHCFERTGNSSWCNQLIRPNPSSRGTFSCTYGSDQPHQLIHPDQSTWKYAYEAVKLVEELEDKGIKVCLIYNWWRPEPYNANVGGSATRHPYGTSVDVRFCSKTDQAKAHRELCKERKNGRIRALGHYASTALHIGVGDRAANTWGKSCP